MAQTQSTIVLLISPTDLWAPEVLQVLTANDPQQYQVEHVKNLAESVSVLQRKPVSIVLSDVDLPDAQGTEICSAICAQNPACPLVMVQPEEDLASALDFIRAGAVECYAQGILGSISLHLRLQLLIERQRHLSLSTGASDATPSSHTSNAPASVIPADRKEGQASRILITDDDATTRSIIRDLLEGHGYVVEEAVDGYAALALIRKRHLEKNPFSLALIDLMMPKMDGFEVIHLVKLRKWGTNLPLLVLTSRGDKDAVLRCKEEQIEGYIIKPIEREALVNRIDQVLQQDDEEAPRPVL